LAAEEEGGGGRRRRRKEEGETLRQSGEDLLLKGLHQSRRDIPELLHLLTQLPPKPSRLRLLPQFDSVQL